MSVLVFDAAPLRLCLRSFVPYARAGGGEYLEGTKGLKIWLAIFVTAASSHAYG